LLVESTLDGPAERPVDQQSAEGMGGTGAVKTFLELIGWRRAPGSVDFAKPRIAVMFAVVMAAGSVTGLLSLVC
jgi:hypothetical protein